VKRNLSKISLLKIMLALSLLLLSCVISGCGEKSVEKLAVGTSIQTGDWNVTLNSFNITKTISSAFGKLPAKTDKSFILIDVSFENLSSTTKLAGFENIIPAITTSKSGYYIVHDEAYQIVDDYFVFGYVDGGKTVRGILPFELPNSASDIDFTLSVDGKDLVWTLKEGLLR